MLQRFPIAVASVKVDNNSENLLSKIRLIFFSLYESNESSKKVYNDIIKQTQLQNWYYIYELRK